MNTSPESGIVGKKPRELVIQPANEPRESAIENKRARIATLLSAAAAVSAAVLFAAMSGPKLPKNVGD
jgi:hypothetical protein